MVKVLLTREDIDVNACMILIKKNNKIFFIIFNRV